VKKEQLLDMIGEAPGRYVKDAKEAAKKRRIPRWSKWMGGIAAMLAVVILINNMPGIPLIVSAKAVSTASESRKTERPGRESAAGAFEAWIAERDARKALVESAQTPVADFAGLVSAEVLSGADDVNCVWSPINAYIALAVTAELTGGETQAELLDVLGTSDTAELRSRISAVWEEIYENNGKEISVLANSLWLDKDVEYVQEKMDSVAYDYYASVYQGDLGSEKTNRAITNWMRNQTGGMLKDRTGNVQLDPEDQMLTIASVIYFQSKWADEFHKSQNTQAMFHAVTGDVEATFMNKKEYETNYFWGGEYGAVQMYLENGSCMWFILPDEGKTVDDVLADGEYMEMITQKYSYTEDEEASRKRMKVNLSVPQFDVSAGVDLKDSLRKAGLSRIFDPYSCDFSPSVRPSEDFPVPPYVASIHQDTRVKIDEEGVEAASYIEIIGAGAAEPPDEIIDFILDRPFVFAVTKSYIPLFVGTVNRP